MITEIKTTYKGLNLHLKELGDINYFVGKNGSGKTRLFDCILNGDAEIKENNFLDIEKMFEVGLVEKNKIFKPKKHYGKCANIHSVILDLYTDCGDSMDGLFKDYELWDFLKEAEGFSIISSDYKDILFNKVSDGQLKIINLISEIYLEHVSKYAGDGEYKKNTLVLLIEEPETFLHPSIIKLLPLFFDKLISKISGFKKTQFFISTHSPFLISALRDESLQMTHKVYMLEDGRTVDPRGKKNTEESSNGYSSEKVLLAVNAMLGVALDDLTPEVFVLAEESVHVLLKSFAVKFGKERNYFEYTTRGDPDTIKMGLTLLKQREVIPFLNSKIYTIFDGKLDSVNNEEKSELEKGLKDGFLYVKDDTVLDLESCYPEDVVKKFTQEKEWGDWDKTEHKTFKKFLGSKEIIDPTKQGIIKSELARYVVENCDEQCLREHLPVLNKIPVLDKIFHNK